MGTVKVSGVHSRRLTRGADRYMATSVYPLSGPQEVGVFLRVKVWTGMDKRKCPQAKKASAAARPTSPSFSTPALEIHNRVSKFGVIGAPSCSREPWLSGLREVLQTSTLHEEVGMERNPQAFNQAKGPCGATCLRADPG